MTAHLYLEKILEKAHKAGATQADALVVHKKSLEYGQRLGQKENLEHSETQEMGVRVFIDDRQAVVATTVTSEEAFDLLIDRAIAMARVLPPDVHGEIAGPSLMAPSRASESYCDPVVPSLETLINRAQACEEGAQSIKGVTNSGGAQAGWGQISFSLATSKGFFGEHTHSSHTLSIEAIAEQGSSMESESEWHRAVYAQDLEDPAFLGKKAGKAAVASLNPRKVKSTQGTVIYGPDVSATLLSHFTSAATGDSIVRKNSFLLEKLRQQVFASSVTIVDDPLYPRGLRSLPFDVEGIIPQKRFVVAEGILETWFLDSRSAQQLGMTSTGHARRAPSGLPFPTPSNLYMMPGTDSPDTLIASVKQGLYVTSLMGVGVNPVTGDYSRGAKGFWIENGKITYPVSEVTIADNLLAMYRRLHVGNDLKIRTGIDAPTVLIENMTIAGL